MGADKIVFEEICMCGGKLTLTDRFNSFQMDDNIKVFRQKHADCNKGILSMPLPVRASEDIQSNPLDAKLTSIERNEHAKEAVYFPGNQLVYSLTDVEMILRDRLRKLPVAQGNLTYQDGSVLFEFLGDKWDKLKDMGFKVVKTEE